MAENIPLTHTRAHLVEPGLLALVDANARAFGPVATALRILELTNRRGDEAGALWRPFIEGCLWMNPLACWLRTLQRGDLALARIAADVLRRDAVIVDRLLSLLAPSRRVLLVGHDQDVGRLLQLDVSGRFYRQLSLADEPQSGGAPGVWVPPPGALASMEPPLGFYDLEKALDWADSVVLTGFPVHSCNLLGPAQLRPLLMSARDQVDRVVIACTRERNLANGTQCPVSYSEEFRPCWWSHAVTHLVTDQESNEGIAQSEVLST